MSATTVHHAYNDVVATHYDLDPQGIIGRSLDLGVRQLEEEGLLDPERRLAGARPRAWGRASSSASSRRGPAIGSCHSGSTWPRTCWMSPARGSPT